MNLSPFEAFVRFGAKPKNRQSAVSAIASDGAMVLNCEQASFRQAQRGVLRYENRVSNEAMAAKDAQLLAQHLTLARDGALPVRMVVSFVAEGKSGARGCHVRPDLIGKVVIFDGDHFAVEFERREEQAPARSRK